MADAAQQFKLIVDQSGHSTTPQATIANTPAALEDIEVPAGVSYLNAVPGQRAVLSTEMSAPTEDAFVIETVLSAHQPYLMFLSPASRRARVNGQRVPRVAFLRVGDQLQLDDEYMLHVTIYYRPYVGPPAADHLGVECPVCRVPFTHETTIYICPACATALHCEGEDKPAGERLECVRLTSHCPKCEGAIVMIQGYAYIPELCNG